MTIKELRTKIDNANILLEDVSELIDKTMEDFKSENLMTLKSNIEQAQDILDEIFYEARDIEVTITRVIRLIKEVLAYNS